MKVLIVCSGNNQKISPFISEQVESLNAIGISTSYYLVKGKGIFGYLGNLKKFKQEITLFQPDIIHAHYGLCGLLSCLQKKVPVVVTYHGSDINDKRSFTFSKLSVKRAAKNIFVSTQLKNKTSGGNSIVIPCGINTELFKPLDKKLSRQKMNLSEHKKYILFSSSFDNPVKNYSLAKEAVAKLNDPNVELLELKNRTREEVVHLMNSANAVLLTSFSEGSPQFIKEAMACNVTIVSTNVGDIKEIIGQTQGCYISDFNVKDVCEKITLALNFNGPTNGRENIKHLEIGIIAHQILGVYKKVLKEK